VSEKHAFLSDGWIAAVEKIVAEQGGAAAGPHGNMMMNLVVTDTPFGEDKQFHMGTADGSAVMGGGHREGADLTMTTDYGTAKEVFISGNQQAGMQAFMAGKVKVQGDMTKLMAAQAGGGPAGNDAMQQAIKDLTE
jgi:putative sterol carrier protein